MAHAAYLLSRDLLSSPTGEEWRSINVAPAEITNLAVRAAMIYGLSEPWRWRQGRYDQFLNKCLAHLSNCLKNQEKAAGNSPLTDFYRGLSQWYEYYVSADQVDQVDQLSSMVKSFKSFLDGGQDDANPQRARETAERLIRIGESLNSPDRESVSGREVQADYHLQPLEVTAYLRDIVDNQILIEVPSRLFMQCLATYYVAHAAWRNLPWNRAVNVLLHKDESLKRIQSPVSDCICTCTRTNNFAAYLRRRHRANPPTAASQRRKSGY